MITQVMNVTEFMNATAEATTSDSTAEVTTVKSTTSATTSKPDSSCPFEDLPDGACYAIYAAIGIVGLLVIAAVVTCTCCIWRKRKSRKDTPNPPKPPPPDLERVHTDEHGNKYKLDHKGNKVYISDDSDSDPEVPKPRPPAPDPRNRYNQGFELDQDSSLPENFPSRSPPPLPRKPASPSPKRKTPPPPTSRNKPPIKRHIDDTNIFGEVEQISKPLDHGLTYDDVSTGQDFGGMYDPVDEPHDFDQSYIMPDAHHKERDYGGDYEETSPGINAFTAQVHGNPPDWGGDYEDTSLGMNTYPPRVPQKPADHGEDYEEPRSTLNITSAHGKQMGYMPQHGYPLPEAGKAYKATPMGQPMGKGVLDPADIELEEYIQDDVYQNEPVMNPKAKSSNRYKNLHMTKGEKVESEKPYVIRR